MVAMKLAFALLAAVCLESTTLPTWAAGQTRVSLLLGAESVTPGSTVWAGIRFQMDPGWHIYWRNAGDSGMATAVEWGLPPGITAGEIQWPVPTKLVEDDLVTYIYGQEVVLLVPLVLTNTLAAGPLNLTAKVSWLECKTTCVPGDAAVSATLSIGGAFRPSPEADLFRTWQRELPPRIPDSSVTARWEGSTQDPARRLVLEYSGDSRTNWIDFLPYTASAYEVQGATERVALTNGRTRLLKSVKRLGADWPLQIPGLLVNAVSPGGRPKGGEVELRPGDSVNPAMPSPVPPGSARIDSTASPPSFWRGLVMAFLGGLILNFMPCVLPVIALKIVGLVKHSGESPARIRNLGLIYGLGIIVSFLTLAALVIGIKMAGHRAGWGMQFGNPEFLVLLTLLTTLIALNLFGVFEVNPGGKIMGAAVGLTARSGSAGAFFNGVLATILSTPCTAPFLAAALGYALVQSSPAVIVAIFSAIGAGLATPYVVLTWNPRWLGRLPKPGAWMEQFKVAMGFPMLATAVWLFSLTPLHYGRRVLWLGLFLVLIALAAWIYGQFVQRGQARRGWARSAVLLLVVFAYFYGLESQLRWRVPNASAAESDAPPRDAGGIAWQRWSPSAVAQARAAGHPVLVDFTADWCLTCQVNKRTSLEIPAVRAKLKAIQAVALMGDYTTVSEAITAELNRFARAGVPLVLVYPRNTNAPPMLLPEVLTPAVVLHALDQSTQ
jgi:thiol:disulfide interchange protein